MKRNGILQLRGWSSVLGLLLMVGLLLLAPGQAAFAQTDLTDGDGGTITVSAENSPGEIGTMAYDNSTSTKWLAFQATAWITYQFGGGNGYTSYIVDGYSLTSANDAPERDPLNWTLSGSNDGTNFTVVDTRSGEDFPSRYQTRTFSFSNSTAYEYYRFDFVNNTGTIFQIAEIELFGLEPITPGEIRGIVFRDYDMDGAKDTGEPGVAGITVRAYDSDGNQVGSDAVTGTSGDYAFSGLTDGIEYRLEFTDLPSYLQPGPCGTDSQSTVAFATSPASSVFVGLANPDETCDDLATNYYVRGNQSGTDDVLAVFPYDSSGNSVAPTGAAAANEIGTTWGLAHHRASDGLFAGAYTKRHAGYGPNGTGAVYLVQDATTSPAASLFLDLNVLFGAGTAGTTTRSGATNFDRDVDAFADVGKVALGDMDISDDGETLWLINLADRNLYEIPVGTGPTAPPASSINRYDIVAGTSPASCDADGDSGNDPDPNPTDDLRPFGVGVENGVVYVGLVCSAESTAQDSDLRAYVYSFSGGSFSANPVLEFALDFPRGCANGSTPPCNPNVITGTGTDYWRYWVSDWSTITGMGLGSSDTVYPSPMLTDIDFDGEDMIIGMRDRFADQLGDNNSCPPTAAGTCNISVRGAGDILRACYNSGTGGWDLENGGSCGGVTATGNGSRWNATTNPQGPGNSEFYYADEYEPSSHDETALGGIAQATGMGEVASTVYDPNPSAVNEGGVRWFDNSTGAREDWYRIYDNTTARFRKAGGLGDLEALCSIAPIEIGNRIWADDDGDGIQDPGEPILGGVTVYLYTDPDGIPNNGDEVLAGTATSDASTGVYLFNASNVSGGVQPSTNYIVAFNPADPWNSSGLEPTAANTSDNLRDSDGSALPANGGTLDGYVGISLTTGAAGHNNHTYDQGWIQPTAVELTSFTAAVQGNAIVLNWETATELDNLGFNLYRSESLAGGRAQLNGNLIPAQAPGSAAGASYQFMDDSAAPGVTYYYWLEDVDLHGGATLHGPVSGQVQPLRRLLPTRPRLAPLAPVLRSR